MSPADASSTQPTTASCAPPARLRPPQRRAGADQRVLELRGEPMVCSPRDALAAFFTPSMDALALGRFLVEKQRH
jgi:carbamoyltransferase